MHYPWLTDRGTLAAIDSMLKAIAGAQLDELDQAGRVETLTQFQQILVNKIRELHSQQRLEFAHNPASSTKQTIDRILKAAREQGKEGPVAQYLVGAKLQARFPEISVRNVSYSTAHTQTGEPGDFYIGDTAFHVTVAPMLPVFQRCKTNTDQGLRVYLLVPERSLIGARQNAEGTASGKIAVESVESFVAQNLDELGTFTLPGLREELRRLLLIYNERVDIVEADKSMLIDVPQNL